MHEAISEIAFNVVGISIRTTNKEAIEEKSIQKLWQRFFEEKVLSKINSKADNAIIALYYNYENDKNGAYDLLLGARVFDIAQIPEGLIAQEVPAAQRIVFKSDIGAQGNRVLKLWQKIWNMEHEGLLNRSYIFDYELYDESNKDPNIAQMEIHLGVK